MYLLHRTILCQLQGKIRKCLAYTGHYQVLKEPICFSSGYSKNWWNVTLCWLPETEFNSDQWCFFLYHTLRRHCRLSITVNHSLPLIWHKGTYRCPWQRQISRRLFRAWSSGLYRFTHMTFRWSNSGSSFCCLMEMCLGDQQFMTL